jgi:hypothetical protein
MPETHPILKLVEFIVSTWINNTPKFLQPQIGWEIYWKISDRLA